jgi:molybdopterin-guanine dinucleotide biosynthesis protein A
MINSIQKRDVVILAGSSKAPDALTLTMDDPRKALLEINGRPMLSYVIDALRETDCMRHLILVGLSANDIHSLNAGCPIVYLPNQGSIVDNMLSAVDALSGPEQTIVCGCDIPLLTKEAVRDFLEASGADFCYPVVLQETMEERFPGSGRSFRKLADGAFAGGDICLISPDVVRRSSELARTLAANRKEVWGLVKALGPGIILRFLFHHLRIKDAERRINKILRCSCKAIISPYAELAMDVDKPHHLQVVVEAMSKGQH